MQKDIILCLSLDGLKNDIDIEDIEQTLINDFGNFCKIRKINSENLQKFFNQFEKLEEPLEQFSVKVDDVNRFKDINEPISAEKWDYLDRYYFKPLEDELQKAQEIYYDTLIEED